MRLRYGIIMYIFSDYDDDVRLLINFDLTKSAPYSEPLFDLYLNTCPDQGSRTIRSEEAILISLSTLRPKIWNF